MPLHGKGMLIVFNEVKARDERDFNEWYNREHIDERVNLPGFRRGRRYVAVRGSPKYLATYECDTVEDLATPGYLALLANQTPWTQAVMANFTQFNRLTLRVQVDLAHGVGGAVAAVRFVPDPRERKALVDWLHETALPKAIARPGMVGALAAENDLEVAHAPLAGQEHGPSQGRRGRMGGAAGRQRRRRRGRGGTRDVHAREPEEFWRFGGADDRHLSSAVRQPEMRRDSLDGAA